MKSTWWRALLWLALVGGTAGGLNCSGCGGDSIPEGVEVCTNGTDDNDDGLIDCNDPTCSDVVACLPEVEHCYNGDDDDANGVSYL